MLLYRYTSLCARLEKAYCLGSSNGVGYRFTTDGIIILSEGRQSDLNWSEVKESWIALGLIIFIDLRGRFIAIPIHDLGAEVKPFIKEKLQSNNERFRNWKGFKDRN